MDSFEGGKIKIKVAIKIMGLRCSCSRCDLRRGVKVVRKKGRFSCEGVRNGERKCTINLVALFFIRMKRVRRHFKGKLILEFF